MTDNCAVNVEYDHTVNVEPFSRLTLLDSIRLSSSGLYVENKRYKLTWSIGVG